MCAAGLLFELLVTADRMPAALELVRAMPHTRFVLNHAGGPPVAAGAWELWATGVTTLAAHDNVMCKFSVARAIGRPMHAATARCQTVGAPPRVDAC
ncbi:amidohydrolase family protein [Nocardia gipuzkoensis]